MDWVLGCFVLSLCYNALNASGECCMDFGVWHVLGCDFRLQSDGRVILTSVWRGKLSTSRQYAQINHQRWAGASHLG